MSKPRIKGHMTIRWPRLPPEEGPDMEKRAGEAVAETDAQKFHRMAEEELSYIEDKSCQCAECDDFRERSALYMRAAQAMASASQSKAINDLYLRSLLTAGRQIQQACEPPLPATENNLKTGYIIPATAIGYLDSALSNYPKDELPSAIRAAEGG